MSNPTNKHTNNDAANEEIAALKAKIAELEETIERNEQQSKLKLAQQKLTYETQLDNAKDEITVQEVEIAFAQEASDHARRAFVELQYKVDLEKMPLYAERMEEDEIDEMIERQLRESDEEQN
ncbi:hypothetical protein PRZ48_008869 [Zasmidium cellare]|uniref:Uncharacterized protein n=1 Tax=Zasmidium cellare TaxID=395010 RepID=A0ABR0EHD1_ZASCE|nr:hypothetical protein PRZ48_008869 [Zasmidium cellare]